MGIHKGFEAFNILNLGARLNRLLGRVRNQGTRLFKLSSPQIDGVATEVEDPTRFARSHTVINGVDDFLS